MGKSLTFLLLACLCVPLAGSQEDDQFDTVMPETSGPQRKRSTFWRRPRKGSPREQLAYAEELEARGATRKAAKQYRALVHEWHDAPEAVEAQLAHCRLLEARGKYSHAFKEYQYMTRFFTGCFSYDQLLERQFAIANHIMTARRLKLFFLRGFAAPERALTLFEQIVENAPKWLRAAEAQYRVGWIHEQMHDYEDAVAAYEGVLHLYPRSEFVDAAGFRRAHCLYSIARRNPRNEVACSNALSALAMYVNRYAKGPQNIKEAKQCMARLKSLLAGMYYERAAFYDRIGRGAAGVISYRDFVKRFPDDDRTGEALIRIEQLDAEQKQEGEDE